MGIKSIDIDVNARLKDIVFDASQSFKNTPTIYNYDNATMKDGTETMDLDAVAAEATPKVEDIDLDSITSLEDLEKLAGKLSYEQYAEVVKRLENLYDIQISLAEETLTEQETVLAYLNYYLEAVKPQQSDNGGAALITYNKENAEMYLEYLKEHGIEINSIAEAEALQIQLQNDVVVTRELINAYKNMRGSVKYDYMFLFKEYADHEMKIDEGLLAVLAEDSNVMSSSDFLSEHGGDSYNGPKIDGKTVYDYTAFHEKHPEVNPMEYMLMVPEDAVVLGVDNYDQVRVMARVYEKHPDYAKTYSYLYSQDPESAKEFIRDDLYIFNNLQAQIEAQAFLKTLHGLDQATIDKILANEFGVAVEGVADGMTSWAEGVYYTGEAAATGIQTIAKAANLYDGEVYENRVKSVNELKRQYILQGLMSRDEKIQKGIIDENGNNKNPGAYMIDLSQEYAGPFLDENYKISQKIGNKLPAIMISMAIGGPASSAATAKIGTKVADTMSTISSAGASYHSAMVDGYSYLESLSYTAFTIANDKGMGKAFKKIPALNDESMEGLKKLVLQGVVKPSTSTMSKTFTEELYKWTAMGKKMPETVEEWGAFFFELSKKGACSVVTSKVKAKTPEEEVVATAA